MKIRFAQRATQDLSDIADYIRAENPGAASRVRESILKSIKVLEDFPWLGREQSFRRVRKIVTRKYCYVAYYTVDTTKGEVRILAIQHPARERRYSNR
jgi:toxin ParE1/3/4